MEKIMIDYMNKKLPKPYLEFVTKLEENMPYVFFYDSDDTIEKDAGIWCISALKSKTYSETLCDFEYFKNEKLINLNYYNHLSFKSQEKLSLIELQECFCFGDTDGGFLVINTNDQSVWVIYIGDAYAAKLSASFENFIKTAILQQQQSSKSYCEVAFA